jgi:hypothetical protein
MSHACSALGAAGCGQQAISVMYDVFIQFVNLSEQLLLDGRSRLDHIHFGCQSLCISTYAIRTANL